jgi:2-polyprenyl-3-methyl-5-hydroxy-6-metoxy-1,4-benzoquinol methylase
MNIRLAKLLVCPQCKGDLTLESSAGTEERIISGSFRCARCVVQFPILNGIPRFVPNEAYLATFGFEWKQWRRTQFDTASRKSSETTFVVSTGTRPETLRGKLVLDGGCGPGRFMEVVARAGAEVVGVDFSSAIEVAQENLGHLPNCHFVQADLLQAPFRPETFDFAFSIGVLHHTPNTKEAFLHLVRTLKPGGQIAIWVYPLRRLTETFQYFPNSVNETLAADVQYRVPARWHKLAKALARPFDWITETSSYLERAFTTRLPVRWLYGLSHLAIPLYYVYRIPLFYPLRLVTKTAMDPDPEWRVLDTFDWYSPRYQWKHTYPEVRAWFEGAGLEDVRIFPRPVAVGGRKPGTI